MKRALLCTVMALLVGGWVSAQINTIGLIGTAQPGQWDVDTNMVQDVDSAHLWTLTMELTDGEGKFRANDDWVLNWGDDAFPIGTGEQDGLNIPVVGGLHDISFNSNTGDYYFSVVSPVGIIGSATPFGWDADMNMYPDPDDDNAFFLELDLVAGEAKFRLDDDWFVNWGSSDFPEGVGVQDGDNIPVPLAGRYMVTLDTASGAYAFTRLVAFDSVSVTGSAVPGGSMTMVPDPNSSDVFSLSADFTDGDLQFQGHNTEGDVFWGANGFPTDTAVVDGGPVPVTGGKYVVTFNTRSLIYAFDEVLIFQSMGIIGDATPNGWDGPDIDMERSSGDSSVWTVRTELTDGEAKFRADDDWVFNWGAGDFPAGTAELDGANIPITAGEYRITFNSFTGVYNFLEILVYDSVGLIGTGTPFGDWDNDVYMDQDPDDENRWTLTEVTLADGEIKFRANTDWAVNWGDVAWPEGTGTQDGPNIPSVAGTYGVVLNSASGEYAFGDPLSSTAEVLDPADVHAYPNPAADVLHVDVSAVPFKGNVRLDVYDMAGQLRASYEQAVESVMQVGVSRLPNGPYMLQITGDGYIIGKKFVVARK